MCAHMDHLVHDIHHYCEELNVRFRGDEVIYNRRKQCHRRP